MLFAHFDKFYEQDTKEYEIKNNKDFLNLLKYMIDNGYHSPINIGEMQELINNIANWYEIKYPERELEHFEGTRYMNFQDIKRISNVMNIRQLLFRLPHNQLCLMESGYRAKYLGQHSIYENNKEVGLEVQIFIKIYRKNKEECNPLWGKSSYFFLEANQLTGKIFKDHELEEYIDGEEAVNLDDILEIFTEDFDDELDFTELEECVFDHNCDIELRRSILQLVALKLLYSRNTIPERGYERARRFISEFNKKLGLNLSTEQIDEIMHRDYANVEYTKDMEADFDKIVEDKENNIKILREFYDKFESMVEEAFTKMEKKEETKVIKRLVKKLVVRNNKK
jgi:hypothetical protein